MPIRPEHRRLYPSDWRELSRAVRFERAKGRCEGCGRPHGRLILHACDGRWFDKPEGTWRDGSGAGTVLEAKPRRVRLTKVVLAAAHLDHNPANNDPSNLKALCQRCHILNDREEHKRRRAITILLRRACGDLFLGPYR